MSLEFGLQSMQWKTMTSPNTKPEVVLRRRSNCNEFKNDRNNHITVISMLFCISLSNGIESGHAQRINDVLSIFKTANGFKGSMETAHTHTGA